MLTVGLITLFPEMFTVLDSSITGKALQKGLIDLQFWNPREFTTDKHQTVDDRPYGGGPGMLMKVQPLRDAIIAAKKALGTETKVVYLSPQGKSFKQQAAQDTAALGKIIFICGRYEGIDERLLETDIDEEWSLGDFVLTGGELAAMVMIDAASRAIPGVIGHAEAAGQDSFSHGLLDFPQYTRPEEIDGRRVPAVLLSGDHGAIESWRKKQALGNTWLKRPDLLETMEIPAAEQALLSEFIKEQG